MIKPDDLIKSGYGGGLDGWSRDGNTPLYLDNGKLWAYSFRESKLKPLIDKSVYKTAGFSPDGRWIVYDSGERGNVEVYVQPFPVTGAKFKVSKDGGHHPVWSPDGKAIYYLKTVTPQIHQLMSVTIQTSSASAITFGLPTATAIKNVFQSLPASRAYDVMPDGKRFIVTIPADDDIAPKEIRVVMNWFEELKRRVPLNRGQ